MEEEILADLVGQYHINGNAFCKVGKKQQKPSSKTEKQEMETIFSGTVDFAENAGSYN